MSRRQDLILY